MLEGGTPGLRAYTGFRPNGIKITTFAWAEEDEAAGGEQGEQGEVSSRGASLS